MNVTASAYAPPNDVPDGLEQLLRMCPYVDVPLRPLLRGGHVNETRVRENEPRDEGRRPSARRDGLPFLEPKADASAKELRDAPTLCLVPAQARFEVAFTGVLVLEQAVESQGGSGYRHDDRGVVR
jgi:hypothetical protein